MRGNKKLIQRISKAGATGILACAVSFSLPQIMQTEDTLQIKGYGISGSMFELGEGDLFSEALSRAVTFGRNDMITVEAAARDSKNLYLERTTVKAQTSNSDSLNSDSEDKEDAIKTIVDNEQDTEEDVKAKADNIKENAKSTTDKEISVKTTKSTAAAGEDAKKQAAPEDTDKNKSTNTKTSVNEKTTTQEDTKKETASTNKSDTKAKTTAEETAETKGTTAKAASSAAEKSTNQTSAAKKWKNKLMADVDDRLNIRKSSSEDSEIVGRLRKGDVAEVIKKGKEWTKIKSGSVTGYVKNEYCVYGAKAYKLAKKVCKTYATVQTDGLRIRKKPSEESTILDAAYKGDKLTVNTKAKEKDGWVVVSMDDFQGYVSEEYVNVALGVGKALSIEEEMEQIAAQKKAEEEAAARAAANRTSEIKSVSASSNSAVSSNNSAVQAASSDLTLLSAIIYCEAGGESYAGQVAVGAVVMNRVNSGSFPNSISGVVYQSGQFSPVANGALARALSNGSYQNCVSAAREALAGSDNTGGAKFFHRVNGDAGLVIGNHVFY